MATGTLDDFLDKYGFNDGDSVENRDFDARDVLVRFLNRHLTRVRAVPYDRPGFHNPCMILAVKVRGKSDPPQGKLVRAIQGKNEKFRQTLEFVRTLELPEDLDVTALIDKAYGVADRNKIQRAPRVKIRLKLGKETK